MKHDIKLGQKVTVNTGGNDTIAIIDYPTIRKNMYGKERSYLLPDGSAVLCRFTEDINKCWVGGAKYEKDSYKAEDNTLCINAQYIPLECITPI